MQVYLGTLAGFMGIDWKAYREIAHWQRYIWWHRSAHIRMHLL